MSQEVETANTVEFPAGTTMETISEATEATTPVVKVKKPKVAKEPKEPKIKVAKEVKVKTLAITQNGVSRPAAGTGTGRVWEIADEVSKSKKAPATRSEVVAAATVENLHPSTASTQYGRWCRFHGLKFRAEKPEPAAEAPAAVEA